MWIALPHDARSPLTKRRPAVDCIPVQTNATPARRDVHDLRSDDLDSNESRCVPKLRRASRDLRREHEVTRFWIALGGLLLSFPMPVGAQCTTTKDASAVLKSAKLVASCNYSGSAADRTSHARRARRRRVPKRSLATRWRSPGARTPIRQSWRWSTLAASAISSSARRRSAPASSTSSATKLRYLVQQGCPRPTPKPRRDPPSTRLPRRASCGCSRTRAASSRLDVGPQMDAAVPAVGNPVDGSTLATALVTLLETWVDRVGPHPAPLRPNIVFILTDDQRFDTIGLTHSDRRRDAGHADGAARDPRQGRELLNSYATTDLLRAPSRSSLRGREIRAHDGVHDNGGPDGGFGVFDDSSTLPVWLQAAGYHTGSTASTLNGYQSPYIAPRGWDEGTFSRTSRVFQLTLVENGTEVLRQRRHRLFDRRPARQGGAVHPERIDATAVLCTRPESAMGPPRRRRGMQAASRHLAVAAAELQRARRHGQTGLAARHRAVDREPDGHARHFQPDAARVLQAVDEAVAAILQALIDTGQDRERDESVASDARYRGARTAGSRSSARYECSARPAGDPLRAARALPRAEIGVRSQHRPRGNSVRDRGRHGRSRRRRQA